MYLEPNYDNVNIKRAMIDAAKLSMRGIVPKLFFYFVLGVIPYLLYPLIYKVFADESHARTILINVIFLIVSIFLFALASSSLLAMARKTDSTKNISYADCVWNVYKPKNAYQIIKNITCVMLILFTFGGLCYAIAQGLMALLSAIPGVEVLPINSPDNVSNSTGSVDLFLDSIGLFGDDFSWNGLFGALYYMALGLSVTVMVPPLVIFHGLNSAMANKVDHYGLFIFSVLNPSQGNRVGVMMTLCFMAFLMLASSVICFFLTPLWVLFITSLHYVLYRQVYLGVMENNPVKSKSFNIFKSLVFAGR